VVDTTTVTAMLYWLFFGSSALIGVYTLAGGTRLIQEAMTNLPVGPMGVILIMMLIWIILGCFIDWIGILLLTARSSCRWRASSASTWSGSACCSA
jgi:TRAP-type mannitol/chloroaromatic compound transport system permease large subunit